MPLLQHLAEFRDRVFRSAIVITIGFVVAWFFYNEIIAHLAKPVCDLKLAQAKGSSNCGALYINGVLGPINLQIKVSLIYLHSLCTEQMGAHSNQSHYRSSLRIATLEFKLPFGGLYLGLTHASTQRRWRLVVGAFAGLAGRDQRGGFVAQPSNLAQSLAR